MNSYWINVLENVQFVIYILAFLGIIISGVFTLISWSEKDSIYSEDFKKRCKFSWTITALLLLGSIFIPGKKQLMEMYGPQEVVEHLRHGDVEGISEETIQIFEDWANGRK